MARSPPFNAPPNKSQDQCSRAGRTVSVLTFSTKSTTFRRRATSRPKLRELVSSSTNSEAMDTSESSEVQVAATVHRCPLCPFLTESVTDFCRHMCIHTDTVAATNYDQQHQRPESTTANDPQDIPDQSGQALDDKEAQPVENVNVSLDTVEQVEAQSTQVVVTTAAGDVGEVVTTVADGSGFCCCVCGSTFSNTEELQNHLRAHTESATSILACSACGLVFTDKDALDAHLPTHNGEATGSLCWVYTTTDDKDLMGGGGADTTTASVVVLTGNGLTHIADTSPQLQIKPPANTPTTTSHNVTVEQVAASTSAQHTQGTSGVTMVSSASVAPQSITVTPTTLSQKTQISTTSSTTTATVVSSSSTVEESEFTCGVCEKVMPDKEQLDSHMSSHAGERPFSCTVCNKAFSRREHMGRHMRTHTGERPFSCYTCNKRFSRKVHLESHIRIHTGERPYVCTLCGKAFGRKEHIERHVRIHTGERSFMCGSCGRAFSQKVHLENHARVHTGERPFQCVACGKSFRRREYMKRHMRTHTGERPFQCGTCGKSFRQKSHVDRHTRTHTQAGNITVTSTTAGGDQQVVQVENQEEIMDSLEEDEEDVDGGDIEEADPDDLEGTSQVVSIQSPQATTQTITIQQSDLPANLQETQVIHVTPQEMEQIQAAAAAAANAGLEKPKVIVQTLPTSNVNQASQQKVRVVEMVLTCATCGRACLSHMDFQQHLRSHLAAGTAQADQQFVAVVEIDQQAFESGQIVLADASGQFTQMQLTGEAVMQDADGLLKDDASTSQVEN